MIRLNLFLVLLAVASAVGTVTSNHRARKMFAEIEHEQSRMRDLEVEWGQLQLEQSTLASHARVEKVAREKLHMKAPAAGQVMTIEIEPAQH
ncbi:MAG: cell division protein FtsL [Betaproteobacteria bacterium]|nr:cell division protein FtsL [Betaproteobacteria bacterium]